MSKLRDLAYQIDPAQWVHRVLGVEPAAWQAEFLRAPRGASIVVLTARQVGKTTAAAWAIAHYMLFAPGGLSVIACPAQRQSAEAVRRVRGCLIQVGVHRSPSLPPLMLASISCSMVRAHSPKSESEGIL
jgi:hypothetical protein